MNMDATVPEKETTNEKRNYKLLIIGAGISGIAAGNHLSQSGFKDFKIIEASDRTGGRIWTIKIDDEHNKVEMGANWIHGIERNPIFKIAYENNLLELRHGDKGLRHKNLFRTEDGEEINERTVNQINLLYGQLIIQAEDYYQSNIPTPEENDSVGAFLEREFSSMIERYSNGDRHVREILFDQRKLLECCISGCDTLDEVSLSEFGGYQELPGVHYSIPKGFKSVLNILKKNIPTENILLNTPVKCIHWNRKHSDDNQFEVKVECENGEVFYANHVLVTVSLGVLKAACDRMFDPPLPPDKLLAIDRVGFGIVDKVIVQFDEPITPPEVFHVEMLWDKTKVEIPDLRHTWYRKIYSLEVTGGNVLVGWLSGKEALYMESLTEEQVGQDIVSFLKKFLKKKDIPQPKKVIRTRWGNNRYTRGSYSFIQVGASMSDTELLAEPVFGSASDKPQLLFAGEATHSEYYSTTHGALETGKREATRFLDMYNMCHS
ncbi:spermine oxidase-like [Mizuhopecten yessoensis]|uniref:spermine oxidase-like n=1 Tax=Mizuhopecten yessoensis TaxID=6573 RepID=UPI000B459477|nr:spermine oxidase-like [Mizuhopecten yessoensis]